MEKIIIIVFLCGIFIFFLWLLLKMNKKEKKQEPEKKEEKKEVKDEIPQIIKDVTMGNYMYDIAQNSDENDVEIIENANIKTDEEKSKNDAEEGIVDASIEKAFDYIDDIGDDYDDILDDDIDEIDSITETFDDELYEDDELKPDEENGQKESALAKEYKGLSKEMKAMLIANILEKKH